MLKMYHHVQNNEDLEYGYSSRRKQESFSYWLMYKLKRFEGDVRRGNLKLHLDDIKAFHQGDWVRCCHNPKVCILSRRGHSVTCKEGREKGRKKNRKLDLSLSRIHPASWVELTRKYCFVPWTYARQHCSEVLYFHLAKSIRPVLPDACQHEWRISFSPPKRSHPQLNWTRCSTAEFADVLSTLPCLLNVTQNFTTTKSPFSYHSTKEKQLGRLIYQITVSSQFAQENNHYHIIYNLYIQSIYLLLYNL